MQPSDLKDYMRKSLESTRDTYLKDLEAMSPELLTASPGGSARSAMDMTYEVAFFNRRMAKRMRGEPVEPFKFEGWMKAPADFTDPQGALRDSMDELIAAWDATPDAELGRVIEIPSGTTSPFDLAYFAIRHVNYHDAQLNYIQSLQGDDKMHWTD